MSAPESQTSADQALRSLMGAIGGNPEASRLETSRTANRLTFSSSTERGLHAWTSRIRNSARHQCKGYVQPSGFFRRPRTSLSFLAASSKSTVSRSGSPIGLPS